MSYTATIYENLVRLCEFRGAQVTKRIDSRELIEKARIQLNLEIEAERGDNDIRGASLLHIVYFHSHDGGGSDKISPQITKFMKNASSFDRRTNLIFVTDAPISTQVGRNIMEFNSTKGAVVFIEHHMSNIFMVIAPEHHTVPEHRIIAVRGKPLPEEMQKMVQDMHVSIWSQFQCLIASAKYTAPISRPDPMAVWLGMRPGMIIEIRRECLTASGIEITYRRTI